VLGEEFPGVLAAAQAGDERAFLALWRDGNPPLLRYLRVAAPGSADGIAAETWMSVIRGLPRFAGGESAWRAWLFTTARRRVADEGRRRQRRPGAPVAEPGLAEAGRAADAVAVPENLTTRSALAAVASLPPLQAEVIMLRVVAGLGAETVAQLVGRSPGAVRVAAHRGLRKLAETLVAEAGVTR
jgi:RNA polymerase sigma-70 factor, ECF subfamily